MEGTVATWFSGRHFGWVEDLTICGDVESNPGPSFQEFCVTHLHHFLLHVDPAALARNATDLQAERVTQGWDLQSVADQLQYPQLWANQNDDLCIVLWLEAAVGLRKVLLGFGDREGGRRC